MSPRRKQTGRPPLAEGEAKDKVLQVRLTASDRKELDLAALAAGVTASEWSRRLIGRTLRPDEVV